MTAIHEILSDDVKAQLTQMAPQLAANIDTDAPAKTKCTCEGGAECGRCRKPAVGNIRRPRVTRHQPRLECTPEELLAAAKARTDNRDGHINLANITDADLGRMMRAGLLTLVVNNAKANHPEVLAARASQEEAERKALVAERSQRKDDAFVLPEFTAHGVTVPQLDMRSSGELGLALNEAVPDVLRSPYNKVRHAMNLIPLDPDTSLLELGEEHKRLSAEEADVPPGLDKEFLAKVGALVEHAGMTEAQAISFLGQDR